MRIGPSEVRQGFEKAYRVGRLLGKLVLMVALYDVYVFFWHSVQSQYIINLFIRGGFGHVYAGVREKDHKLVAIKVREHFKRLNILDILNT